MCLASHPVSGLEDGCLKLSMDAIKKKMEKLGNETTEAEARIYKYETMKTTNGASEDFSEENTSHGRVL